MTRPSRSLADLAALAASGTPVFYTPEEAAMIIPKTAYWLRREAARGTIACTRVGRDITFTPHDLGEIARAGARKPKPRAGAGPAAVTPLSGARPPGERKLKARTLRRRDGNAA